MKYLAWTLPANVPNPRLSHKVHTLSTDGIPSQINQILDGEVSVVIEGHTALNSPDDPVRPYPVLFGNLDALFAETPEKKLAVMKFGMPSESAKVHNYVLSLTLNPAVVGEFEDELKRLMKRFGAKLSFIT